MSDVKRLLEEATPLPWRASDTTVWHPLSPDDATDFSGDAVAYTVRDQQREDGQFADAALIVHAVNHLLDYEAAVDALERIQQRMSDWQDATQKAGVYREGDPDQQMAKWVHDQAFAALRRLRGES